MLIILNYMLVLCWLLMLFYKKQIASISKSSYREVMG